MTLEKAFLENAVSPTLRELWEKANNPGIGNKPTIVDEWIIRRSCYKIAFFLTILFSLLMLTGLLKITGFLIVPLPFIAFLIVAGNMVSSRSRRFLKDCKALRELAYNSGFKSEEELKVWANRALNDIAFHIIDYQRDLMAENNPQRMMTDPRRLNWYREQITANEKMLKNTFNVLKSFGLVSKKGYGPYFTEAERQLAEIEI